MRLALSSKSLPLRLIFLLGVLCPPDAPDIDTDSETDRPAGVENVPRDPSGNDRV